MQSLMASLVSTLLLLVVIGAFSLIIVAHELGHFLAARWAGIRVLAFAVGFGPALVSYRKGLGWRRGSSEREYQRRVAEATAEGRGAEAAAISTTEYRLNALLFGGYVRMLGQDDADPTARSDEPDSYQSCPVWKRMIVISAGVAMNILIAPVLFVGAFMIGLPVDAPVIGMTVRGSPAATAMAANADVAGVTERGLLPGDVVVSIDGVKPEAFSDIMTATAMARAGRAIEIEVKRPGVAVPLRFAIAPQEDPESKLLQVGIGPTISNKVTEVNDPEAMRQLESAFKKLGVDGVRPGMRLVSVNGSPAGSMAEMSLAAMRSGGEPVAVEFTDENGGAVKGLVRPMPEMQTATIETGVRKRLLAPHLLGLMSAMVVEEVLKDGAAAGLQAGDCFEQIGAALWPNAHDGQTEIRANAGKTLRIVVLRSNGSGFERVVLDRVPVQRNGTIGFRYQVGAMAPARLTNWPSGEGAVKDTLGALRGSRIVSIAGTTVQTMGDVREAVRDATLDAVRNNRGATLDVTVELPPAATGEVGAARTERLPWLLSAEQIKAVHALGWENPLFAIGAFDPHQVVLKADGPVEATRMGLSRTRSAMLATYVTFARLFQGSIKVEHLKGPVGITHIGTMLASKGFAWLLFFMGLISINLAVVNFLPIPIADGGHFLFLLYEQIAGKPASVGVQNAAAITGLVMIVGLFLVVTYNDIANLVSP